MPENETGCSYEDILLDIVQSDLDKSDASLCLAASEDEGDLPTYRKVKMTDNLVQEFRGIVADVFMKYRKQRGRGDLVIRPYQAEAKLDQHEIECVDITEVEAIRDQIAGLQHLIDIENYDGNADFVSKLRFYTIVVQIPNSDPIYCFKWYTPKRELNNSSWFGIWQSGGQYDKFTETLLLFDDKIDCFSRGDRLFILNKDRFQRIFRYFEMVRQVATQTITTIKTQIPIANFDDFQAVCHGNMCILAKLKNISQSPYIHSITPSAIKDIIDRLNLDVTMNEQGMLVFDPRKKWDFFRLLEDGYLHSPLTGQNYEVNSKRPLPGH